MVRGRPCTTQCLGAECRKSCIEKLGFQQGEGGSIEPTQNGEQRLGKTADKTINQSFMNSGAEGTEKTTSNRGC